MLERGLAKKLVIYVSRLEKYEGRPIYQKIVRFLHNHGCAGATVTRTLAGFGASGKMHEACLFRLIEDVPMRIEVVDTARKIMALLPWIYDMVGSGLIKVQDTEVVKYAPLEPLAKEEHAMKHEKLEGKAKMLRIHISESDRW